MHSSPSGQRLEQRIDALAGDELTDIEQSVRAIGRPRRREIQKLVHLERVGSDKDPLLVYTETTHVVPPAIAIDHDAVGLLQQPSSKACAQVPSAPFAVLGKRCPQYEATARHKTPVQRGLQTAQPEFRGQHDRRTVSPQLPQRVVREVDVRDVFEALRVSPGALAAECALHDDVERTPVRLPLSVGLAGDGHEHAQLPNSSRNLLVERTSVRRDEVRKQRDANSHRRDQPPPESRSSK